METKSSDPLRRVPISEARSLLAEQRESDLSVAAFARAKGVQPWSLYNAKASEQRRSKKATERGFAQVRIIDPHPQAGQPASSIELVLASGVAIRIRRDFDEVALRRLLGVLGSC